MAGFDCESLREIDSGLFVAADLQQQTATLVPGFGIARVDLQCSCKIVDRIVGAIEAEQHTAAIVAGLGETGVERERVLVVNKRFRQPIEPFHDIGAVVERLGIVRPQRESAIEAGQGLVVAAQHAQR